MKIALFILILACVSLSGCSSKKACGCPYQSKIEKENAFDYLQRSKYLLLAEK